MRTRLRRLKWLARSGLSLVKKAVHGRDPNWGRIVAAAGRADVAFDRAVASDALRQDIVQIRLGIGQGPGEGCAWGCDLSDRYVRIDADYTT